MNSIRTLLTLMSFTLLIVAIPAQANDPYWDKVKIKCGVTDDDVVKARLRKAGLGKFKKTCEGLDGYSPPNLNKYGITTENPDRCKRVGTSVYGYWDVENHSACANSGARVFWDNAKLKCENNGDGVVKAKLKGVKLGKKKRTCEDNPPEFNALGASGAPDRCKSKVDTSVWGEWDVSDHPGCEAKAAGEGWWAKAVHSCRGPNVGRVKAQLKGVSWGEKKSTCEVTDISTLGDTLGASGTPNECKAFPTGAVFGYWKIENDVRCSPTWGKVRKKGCMSPNPDNPDSGNRQVYEAKLKKLKNTKGVNDTQETRRATCMATEGPFHPNGQGSLGLPDGCKVKGLKIKAFWYVEGESCDRDLEWKKWKDDGCVKDLEPKERADIAVDFDSKRQIRATLKKVGGETNQACMHLPVNETVEGIELNFRNPTVCLSKDGDFWVAGGASLALGVGAAVATAGTSLAVSVGASVATGLIGWFGGELLGQTWDPFESSKAIFWVDDQSCGAIPQYARLHEGDTKVVLATGEISTNLAPWGQGQPPSQMPEGPNASASSETPAAHRQLGVTHNMYWSAWQVGTCKRGRRVWSADLRNIPEGLSWTDACRAAIQLPYQQRSYPQSLQQRLNSADPDIGYPDRCRLAVSGVQGQFHIPDSSCQ